MSHCSKCNHEVPTDFNFCPLCGAVLSENIDGIKLANAFGKIELEGSVLENGRVRLWELGKEMGFISFVEFGVLDLLEKGKQSFIDVVWKSKSGIEFAFEVGVKASYLDVVDSVEDKKKLENLQAAKKYFVNVSETTGRAYFKEIQDVHYQAVASEQKDRFDMPMVSMQRANPNQQKPLSRIEEIRRMKYPRAGKHWSNEEDAELVKDFQAGLSVPELARKHQRGYVAINARLAELGLIEYKLPFFRRRKST